MSTLSQVEGSLGTRTGKRGRILRKMFDVWLRRVGVCVGRVLTPEGERLRGQQRWMKNGINR